MADVAELKLGTVTQPSAFAKNLTRLCSGLVAKRVVQGGSRMASWGMNVLLTILYRDSRNCGRREPGGPSPRLSSNHFVMVTRSSHSSPEPPMDPWMCLCNMTTENISWYRVSWLERCRRRVWLFKEAVSSGSEGASSSSELFAFRCSLSLSAFRCCRHQICATVCTKRSIFWKSGGICISIKALASPDTTLVPRNSTEFTSSRQSVRESEKGSPRKLPIWARSNRSHCKAMPSSAGDPRMHPEATRKESPLPGCSLKRCMPSFRKSFLWTTSSMAGLCGRTNGSYCMLGRACL
mmetsp:Transcript_31032/g.82497  ORF Transcript_31032/g.82497 Transcript_31032/m.82497 type:complete len:294 (-) Transcript_31032:696-1577(-)